MVIANHMLYHVPDPDLAIRELARVLRSDGVLLASTNGYGHMREMNDAITEVFGDHQERLYEVVGIDTGLHRRFAGGTLMIRTRTGAFVCRQPRRRPDR